MYQYQFNLKKHIIYAVIILIVVTLLILVALYLANLSVPVSGNLHNSSLGSLNIITSSSAISSSSSSNHSSSSTVTSSLTPVSSSSNVSSDPQSSSISSALASSSAIEELESEYQTLYPDLVAEKKEPKPRNSKAAYLTFDDGPSSRTNEILDILKQNNIKATFFVVANNRTSSKLLKRIVDEGHSIGVHTATHNYKVIYESVSAFLKDFQIAHDKIYRSTGIKTCIYRYPGGSINSYNKHNYHKIIKEMNRRNFVYFDWNVSTEDTAGAKTKEQIVANVDKHMLARKGSRIVILAHDSEQKYATVESLQTIIDHIAAQGYSFEVLDETVPSMYFAIK